MPTDPVPATVSFSADDALAIAKSLSGLAVAFNPAIAGTVALVTGAAELIRNTILPAISHLHQDVITVVEQATLQAESAAERARVGAPPAALS